ncbi:hypothetical protein J2046_002854 [Rhizobium petrolearium]|nr:hypothetical protein [Neorhizobium petrolearium]
MFFDLLQCRLVDQRPKDDTFVKAVTRDELTDRAS